MSWNERLFLTAVTVIYLGAVLAIASLYIWPLG